MRSDTSNVNSGQYGQAYVEELGGTKKVFTYSGTTAESYLDSETTAYADEDVIAVAGALDVSIAAGTANNDPLNGAVTGAVELFGAGATYRNANLAADLSITEVDVDFNAAGIMWAQPLIILPVATNKIYVRTTTAINHATNFNAGRYQMQIEYTVL